MSEKNIEGRRGECPSRVRTIEQLEDSVAAFDARIEAVLLPFIRTMVRKMPGCVRPRPGRSCPGLHRRYRPAQSAPPDVSKPYRWDRGCKLTAAEVRAAGAIGAHQRLLGTAPAARLLAVHAFSTSAATSESTTFNILKGINWAVNQGVRVINMSFAGPKDPSLEHALKVAYDKNIVLIAAAGNAGPKSPPLYPGAYPDVIAVTATDVDDKLFAGANRGKYVSVSAPGVDILVPAPESTYQLTTGTSVAAAEVSGIVALLVERNPKLTPADVRRILQVSAKRLTPGERDDNFGSGLVDPLKALQLADPRTATTTPATATIRQR
jgi:subtilisin family serine protease